MCRLLEPDHPWVVQVPTIRHTEEYSIQTRGSRSPHEDRQRWKGVFVVNDISHSMCRSESVLHHTSPSHRVRVSLQHHSYDFSRGRRGPVDGCRVLRPRRRREDTVIPLTVQYRPPRLRRRTPWDKRETGGTSGKEDCGGIWSTGGVDGDSVTRSHDGRKTLWGKGGFM